MRIPRGLICLVLAAGTTFGAEPARDEPLAPIIARARRCLDYANEHIKDYTCTLVKRERINGRLRDPEYLFVKLRHEVVEEGRVVAPFAVYLRYLAPEDLAEREVLYVQGGYDGQLITRRGGRRFAQITMAVDPDSEAARQQSRYPVSQLGIKNLLRRLLEVGEEELAHEEPCEVRYFEGAKINERTCDMIEFRHKVRREEYRFYVARVFIDQQHQLPIRFESYDWPKEEGGAPRLLEEYTYLDLNVNVGLTDWDFDYRNEGYLFSRTFKP
jgi:hypothetical protein